MGRMACTEPQCLYKGALYVFTYFRIEIMSNFPNECTYTMVVTHSSNLKINRYLWK